MSLVLACPSRLLGNVQLRASVFLGSPRGPFVLGDRGDSGAGGPSVHMLMGSLRQIRPMINVMAPRLVFLKTAALCLQTSGRNNFLEQDFSPVGGYWSLFWVGYYRSVEKL